ncbi:peroxisomal membrane protein PEX14 isoform X2 [Uranotaenia lowii]|uniref:peroxisomal membrane protein PEX14 isoform X2 n=1 Tax=Uranotaenia lowii TaxID=190385 RepID=UPI002478D333|nr:peroxisomal membrane protein PEX14 isoform X2 [Uranotaenia lowii]
MGEGEESPPTIPPSLPPREHLITTAIKFLNNPNVLRSGIAQKQSFLRSKGLTEDEIQLACERAGVFSKDPNAVQISMGLETGNRSSVVQQQQPQTWFGRMREILNSVAIVSGLMYGVYLFYKRVIEPLIFRGKKPKPVHEQLADLNRTVEVKIDSLSSELSKIKEDLNRLNQTQNTVKEMGNFKSDLDSIKGLLLNRKQFASPNLPVMPPSIPAWQLQAAQGQQRTPTSEGETDKNDDNDTGSGSGSSENDVVLKNSDSSLEIM